MSCRYLVVVRTVGTLLDAGVLFHLAYLHADHGVHVETGQLPGLDDGDAHLKVLRLERVLRGVQLVLVLQGPGGKKRLLRRVRLGF